MAPAEIPALHGSALPTAASSAGLASLPRRPSRVPLLRADCSEVHADDPAVRAEPPQRPLSQLRREAQTAVSVALPRAEDESPGRSPSRPALRARADLRGVAGIPTEPRLRQHRPR